MILVMQKKVHKLIRYSKDGVNVVGDINAAVSTGEGGVTRTSTRSRNRIVQRGGRTWTDSEIETPDEKEVNHGRGDS
jgi:hypothetical protein